jgi:hypothetical protein
MYKYENDIKLIKFPVALIIFRKNRFANEIKEDKTVSFTGILRPGVVADLIGLV